MDSFFARTLSCPCLCRPDQLNQALGLELRRPPTDSSFRDLFRQVNVAEICQQLQAWMLAQIPDGAAGLDQLVCVALGLPRSGWQDPAGLDRCVRGRWRGLSPPADFVYISRVTLYSKALGAAIAQATHDTRANHERAVLRELLSTMNLEGILIQSDALHTQKPFFGSSRSGGPTSS
jgi:hypothetical protein